MSTNLTEGRSRACARVLRRVLAGAAAALLAAGCGGSGGGGADGPVALQVFGDANEMESYRALAAAYRRETGQEIRLAEVPDEDAHIQRITTGFAGGRPPEIFLVSYRNFATFGARGGIDPAGPRLKRSTRLRAADFFPQALEAYTYRGALQCMPQNASSLVVYYNRDLFERQDVPLPREGWTYEDLTAAAKVLTEPPAASGSRRYGIGIDPTVAGLGPFVWSAGGDLVDDPSDPGRFTLATPEARRGLQLFLDLQGGNRTAPFEGEVESKGLAARFFDGELAMLIASRREVPAFRGIEDFEWDVAPFPVIDEPASVLQSDAYCVSRTKRADAAWRFVEWAAGEQGQRILARFGRVVPSHKRAARSREFLDPGRPPESAEVFVDALPAVRRLPVASTWPEIEDAADLAIKQAYYTELTVEETLRRIDEETGALLERARQTGP